MYPSGIISRSTLSDSKKEFPSLAQSPLSLNWGHRSSVCVQTHSVPRTHLTAVAHRYLYTYTYVYSLYTREKASRVYLRTIEFLRSPRTPASSCRRSSSFSTTSRAFLRIYARVIVYRINALYFYSRDEYGLVSYTFVVYVYT